MVSNDFPVPPEYLNYPEYYERIGVTFDVQGNSGQILQWTHDDGPREDYYRLLQGPVPTQRDISLSHLVAGSSSGGSVQLLHPAAQSDLEQDDMEVGILSSGMHSDKIRTSEIRPQTSPRGRRSRSITRRSRGKGRFASVITEKVQEETKPSAESQSQKVKSKGKNKGEIVDEDKEMKIKQYVNQTKKLQKEIFNNLDIFSSNTTNNRGGGSSSTRKGKGKIKNPGNNHNHDHDLSSEKPFKCPEPSCSTYWKRNSDMKRHWLTHLKGSSLLSENERVSKLIKSHACPRCGKPMSRKDSVKRHLLENACGKKEPPVGKRKRDHSEEQSPKRSRKDKED